MNSRGARVPVLLLLTMVLFAGYLVLNAPKWELLPAHLHALVKGQPATGLTIPLRGAPDIDLRLATSDIYDAEGIRQVSFHYPSAAQFGALGQGDRNIAVRIGELPVSATVDSGDGWAAVVLPTRKLYLLEHHDIHTLAALLERESAGRRDILHCRASATVCSEMQFFLDDAWGPLTGPLPAIDVSLTGDDLPRGRWIEDVTSAITIRSSVATKADFEIELLRTGRDQSLAVNSRRVAGVTTGSEGSYQDYDGMQLFGARYRFRQALVPGDNVLRFSFSSAVAPANEPHRIRAAYVSSIAVVVAE